MAKPGIIFVAGSAAEGSPRFSITAGPQREDITPWASAHFCPEGKGKTLRPAPSILGGKRVVSVGEPTSQYACTLRGQPPRPVILVEPEGSSIEGQGICWISWSATVTGSGEGLRAGVLVDDGKCLELPTLLVGDGRTLTGGSSGLVQLSGFRRLRLAVEGMTEEGESVRAWSLAVCQMNWAW